jgi:thioredoxin reductase (NADPH)
MNAREPVRLDVALIGGGPIGLEMAVALQDVGIDYRQFEAQQVGHTIAWFPRQARFFSSPERIAICGVPLLTVDQSKATREEYLTYLLGIVQQFHLQVNTYERVVSVTALGSASGQRSADEPRYRILTERADGRHEYLARSVIFAHGGMHAPRTLAHPGLDHVPGIDLPHVSHYFDEPHPYAGQQLLIVGGRNSAVEAAIRCHRAGAHVTICHRQAQLSESIKYWLKPEIDGLIQAGQIRQVGAHVPVAITRTHVELAAVDDAGRPNLDPDARERIAADFVLLLIGYVMDTTLLRELGVELQGASQAPRVDPQTMETNLPGIYVAGTAAGGTQVSFKLFIENSHAHVVRILRHLAGRDAQHINPLAYERLHDGPLPAES